MAANGNYWVGLARDWGLAAAIVLGGFLVWSVVAAPVTRTEGPAPTFILPDLDGGELDLASFGDRTVVLNFWFSDCGPCRSEIPELAKWSQEHPDVPLIGVSTDQMDVAMLRTRAKQLRIPYPIAHDRYFRVAGQYGVGVFPTTVVIRDGEIRAVRVGALDGAGLDALVAR